MVVIGYPVEVPEALRLTGVEPPTTFTSIYHEEYETALKIHRHLVPHGIGFYALDKGVYVMGILLEAGSPWEGNVTADQAVSYILQASQRVGFAIRSAGIDLSTVTLAHIEGESQVASFPDPFFIDYKANAM